MQADRSSTSPRAFVVTWGSRGSDDYRAIITIEDERVYVLRVVRGAQDALEEGDLT